MRKEDKDTSTEKSAETKKIGKSLGETRAGVTQEAIQMLMAVNTGSDERQGGGQKERPVGRNI